MHPWQYVCELLYLFQLRRNCRAGCITWAGKPVEPCVGSLGPRPSHHELKRCRRPGCTRKYYVMQNYLGSCLEQMRHLMLIGIGLEKSILDSRSSRNKSKTTTCLGISCICLVSIQGLVDVLDLAMEEHLLTAHTQVPTGKPCRFGRELSARESPIARNKPGAPVRLTLCCSVLK